MMIEKNKNLVTIMMMQREERRDRGTKRGGTDGISTGTGRGSETNKERDERAYKENQKDSKKNKLSKGGRGTKSKIKR